MEGYTNGYIQRTQSGAFEGKVSVEGIDLSPISAVFFKKDYDSYIWLKRKKVLDYDERLQCYKEREAQPNWECYLKKQSNGDTVSYKGEFSFMRCGELVNVNLDITKDFCGSLFSDCPNLMKINNESPVNEDGSPKPEYKEFIEKNFKRI